MKWISVIVLCLCSVVNVYSQDVDVAGDDTYRNGMVPVSDFTFETPSYADSLHLPELDYSGRIPRLNTWHYPYYGMGMGNWEVHNGLNLNLGLSAFTSFGKNSFSGWGRNISAVYAKPVNDKLSVALGVYVNSISSGIGGYTDAGITAVVDYRFNNHWEAYLYGQKSFVDNNSLMFSRGCCYGMSPYANPFYNGGDRIGAGLRYHFNQDSFVQLQFEYTRMPDFHDNIQRHWQHPVDRNDK